MRAIRRFQRPLGLFLILTFFSSGCVRLKGNTIYEYVPSMPQGSVPVTVTIERLEDMRSETERKHTKDVEPVAEKVTRKLYDDFRESQLFEQILSGGNQNADLLIKGRIYSFYWKNRFQWYVFVPYINIIILFGVPAGKFTGEVKIALDLISQKSGRVIASYEESAKNEDVYTGYRSFWGLVAGTETTESFRTVTERLKSRILADKDKIVQALK